MVHQQKAATRYFRGMKVVKGTYPLIKAAPEFDRLDRQHREVRKALGGNHCAPVRDPVRILDVGCGTGLWCLEEALHFRQARQVIGLDAVPDGYERLLKLRRFRHQKTPRNLAFQTADATQPLPFADGTFDFVHGRFMATFIPVQQWPQVIGEMARVAKPGGWIEVLEAAGLHDTGTPLIQAYVAALVALFEKRHLDTIGAKLPELLRAAGLIKISSRAFPLGGPGTVEMLAETPKSFAAALLHDQILSNERMDEIIAGFLTEAMAARLAVPIVVAWGQKNNGEVEHT